MAITSSILDTVGSAIYTSSGTTVVSVMYFCNLDSSARSINLNLVSAGNIVAANNQIYKNVTIASGDTFVIDMEKLVLGNGDVLAANASANSAITATVSYVGA